MKRLRAFFFLCLIGLSARCQHPPANITGTYALRYGFTKLTLLADSSFQLETPDDVFSYTFDMYRTRGTWTAEGDLVRLNPGLERRVPKLTMTQQHIGEGDSLTVRIHYLVQRYCHDSLVSTKPADFNMLTLIWNTRRSYLTLVHRRVIRNCSFARRVRHQKIVDSSNTVKLLKEKLDWLEVYSYGFSRPIRMAVTDPEANFFDITVVLPVDQERTPRNKPVIVRRHKAYFFESDGKPWTSIFAPVLVRQAG